MLRIKKNEIVSKIVKKITWKYDANMKSDIPLAAQGKIEEQD